MVGRIMLDYDEYARNYNRHASNNYLNYVAKQKGYGEEYFYKDLIIRHNMTIRALNMIIQGQSIPTELVEAIGCPMNLDVEYFILNQAGVLDSSKNGDWLMHVWALLWIQGPLSIDYIYKTLKWCLENNEDLISHKIIDKCHVVGLEWVIKPNIRPDS